MQTLNVLDHAPVSRADFSAIHEKILGFLAGCELPVGEKYAPRQKRMVDENNTNARVSFAAGSYKLSCLATKCAVNALALRVAKHGMRSKKSERQTIAKTMDIEYTIVGDDLLPIMQTRGTYNTVDIIDGLDCFVAKSPNDGRYWVYVAGTGMHVGTGKKADIAISEARRKCAKAADEGTLDALRAKIAEAKVEYNAKLAKLLGGAECA